MKLTHIFIITSVFAVLALFAISGCIGGSKTETRRKPANPVIAWIDDSTLSITAEGTVPEEQLNLPPMQQREAACSAAKLAAIGEAVRILGGGATESVTDYEQTETGFSSFVKNGSVTSRTYDEKNSICSVVYKIKKRGFKEKSRDKNKIIHGCIQSNISV